MRRVLPALLLVGVVTPAWADVDPDVLAAIKKVKPSDYPSANTLAIRNDQNVVYQANGQFTMTIHQVTLVLTQTGKTAAGSFSQPYAKDGEKMEVITAQVIKPDGKTIQVPKKDIQDTEQGGEMNIYDPNGRAVKVTFSGLAVGDAVEATFKLTRITPTRDNYFNDIFQFQSTEPQLEASYQIDGPASLPLTAEIYHAERGAKIASTKTPAGDRIRYKWSVANSPQLVPEPAMNFSTELPTLVITTDPSWQHFSSWWAQLTEKQMKVTPELKAKVAELVKDKKTDAEKIKALYDFVSSDIRYRGLGVGPRTGYTPRQAHDTMTSRWGVCRDVSILLTTMLRVEGYQAFPVLTNVGDPVLPKIAYDGFNHAIVAMPKPGGGWTYLDPTAKNMNEMLPANEAEQNTLVSTAKGEGLGSIPPIDPGKNLGHAIATSEILADGSLHSKVTIKTKGIFDMVVRSVVAMMSQDQQREAVEQLIHASLPDAVLVNYDTTSSLALWNPMEVTIELKVPNAAVKTGDFRLLRTLVTSGALGLVEVALPQMMGGLPARKFGLDAHVTFEYTQDETVTLPAGMKIVALPNEAKSENQATSIVSKCTQTNATTLSCHRTFALKSRFIDPPRYGELMGSLATFSRIARQPVVLAGGS
jgi:transglutaminase-like putative cysteine protease